MKRFNEITAELGRLDTIERELMIEALAGSASAFTRLQDFLNKEASAEYAAEVREVFESIRESITHLPSL